MGGITKSITYKFKRAIALMLVSLMVLSTPFTSLAVTEGQAGGIGGGGGSSSATGGSGGNNSFSMNQQGYRFTIVDSSGKAVSKTVDVWDKIPSDDTFYIGNYKTQKYGDEVSISRKTLDEFIEAIQIQRDARNKILAQEGKTELTAVKSPGNAMEGSTGSPLLMGDEFRLWMLQGVDMTVQVSSGSGEGYMGSGYIDPPQKTVKSVQTNADGSKTTYYSDGSSYTSKPPKKNTSSTNNKGNQSSTNNTNTQVKNPNCKTCGKVVEKVRDNGLCLKCNTALNTCTTLTELTRSKVNALKMPSNKLSLSQYTDLSRQSRDAMQKCFDTQAKLREYKANGQLSITDYNNLYSQVSTLGHKAASFMDSLEAKRNQGLYVPSGSYITKIDQLFFGQITSYAAETDIGTPSTHSKEEEKKEEKKEEEKVDDYTSTEKGVIKDLLSITENGEFVFKMAGMSGDSTPLTFMADKGYTLIVEPLLYEIPWSYQNGSYSQYVAGTPTNLAEWAVSVSGSFYWLTGGAHMTLLCKNFNRSLALDKDYSFDTMVDEATGANVMYKYDALPGHSLEDGSKVPFNELVGVINIDGKQVDIARQIGYGCHVYYPKGAGKSAQHTYDVDLVDQKGPAPDPSLFTPEVAYGTKSKNIKIEKYYEDLNPSTDKFEPVAFYGRDANPHYISIDDEEPVGYSVADWFTSTKDVVPPANGNIKTETFEKYKTSYNDGQYKYEEAMNNRIGTITISPEDSEIVLHVLLQQIQPVEVDIVKVYDRPTGETDRVDVEKDVEIENGSYYPDTPDNGYNYTEGTTSKDPLVNEPSNWGEVTKTNHTTEEGIPVPEGTNTIYVHYIKDPNAVQGIVLHQNEISHNFDLTVLAPGASLVEVYRMFDSVGDKSSCREIIDEWEDDDGDTHYVRCHESTSPYYSNNHYNYRIHNDAEYTKDFVYLWQESDIDVSDSADEPYGFKGRSMMPNIDFTVQRASNDKITLYPGNNTGDIAKLQEMGFPSEGYKPANTRYNALTESEDIEWNNQFKTNFVWTNISNPTGYWDCSSGHHYYGNWTYQNSADRDNSVGRANNTYSANNNTTIKAYLGKPNEGLAVPEKKADNFDMFGKTYTQNKANYITELNNFEFYPYIKMNFETLDKTFAEVNVTSENLSKIKNISNVDVGVYKNNGKTPLELESTQWSTHAKVHEFLTNKGIADKNIVLPGGAIYDIKASNTSSNVPQTWVGLRSFEMSIPDDLKIALDKQDGIKTTTEAKASGKTLYDNTKGALDNYQIVQWVASGIIEDKDEFIKASDVTLVSGEGHKNNFGGNKLSTDGKYYLNGDGSSRPDIDILDEKFKQTVYRIYSDTSGKVTITKDGTELISAQLRADKNTGVLLNNKEVKLLEAKTHIVSNYVNAVDIGLGSDRDNRAWYNEAFNGVEVVMSEMAFSVGFGNGQDVRSSALDPKLTGKLVDRRDLYNFEDGSLKEKTRTSQFKTSKKSTIAGASGKAPGYVAGLNGTDIMIPNIENLLYTKVFFIPNANVTDLN